jgi:poly(A) polymerase
LGNKPKDFDVATNARPQEVRRLFRNSRIIGRRFRLAQVFFRNEIVEVATFRASPDPPEGPDEWEEAEQEQLEEAAEDPPSRRRPMDEAYGTPTEDAMRRDLTVNALFYNIADFSIVDYVGGIEDLRDSVIRTIGDPDTRYVEDPVRMMRALEYGVRLGFDVERGTLEAIDRCRHVIQDASPARLTYELLEGLRSGHGSGICEAWKKSGVFELAFPEISVDSVGTNQVLQEIDREIAGGRPYPDATLIGALFLAPYYERLGSLGDDSQRLDNVALLNLLKEMLQPAATTMHLSNHTVHLIHNGLFTLSKMRRPPERGRQVLKVARQECFPVAWDLFSLAAQTQLTAKDVHLGWERAVKKVRRGQVDDAVRGREEQPTRPARRRRPRRRRKR